MTSRSLHRAVIASLLVGCSFALPSCTGSSPQQIVPTVAANAHAIKLDPHRKVRRFTFDGEIDDFAADGSGGLWLIWTKLVVYPPISTLVHIDAQRNFHNFRIPSTTSEISNMIVLPTGEVYWAETDMSKIGRATPAGVIREFPTLTAGSSPVDVTPGRGLVWFAEGGGFESDSGGNEAMGAIYPDGKIIEREIHTPADEAAGAGADDLQDDSAGGVWFIATRHDLFCSPVACPEFIGHFRAGNSVLFRRLIPHGQYSFGSLFALGGFWFNDLHYNTQFSLDVMSNEGQLLKQFHGQPDMIDDYPIGTMNGVVWASTRNPFTVYQVTLTSRKRYIPLSPPGAGIDDWFTPIVADNYVWLTDSIRPINGPNAAYAYRFDPVARTFDTVFLESNAACGLGLSKRLVLSGGALWTGGNCFHPAHLFAITF